MNVEVPKPIYNHHLKDYSNGGGPFTVKDERTEWGPLWGLSFCSVPLAGVDLQSVPVQLLYEVQRHGLQIRANSPSGIK